MPAEPEVNPFSREASREGSTEDVPIVRTEHREGLLTRMIEHQTARVPSDVFLFASFCAMALSLAHELMGRHRESRFLGMWVGPLLTMGVYNKLVKTLGAR